MCEGTRERCHWLGLVPIATQRCVSDRCAACAMWSVVCSQLAHTVECLKPRFWTFGDTKVQNRVRVINYQASSPADKKGGNAEPLNILDKTVCTSTPILPIVVHVQARSKCRCLNNTSEHVCLRRDKCIYQPIKLIQLRTSFCFYPRERDRLTHGLTRPASLSTGRHPCGPPHLLGPRRRRGPVCAAAASAGQRPPLPPPRAQVPRPSRP